MGRRSREVQQRRQQRERVRATRDRMSRVHVSDDTWTAYRAALGSTPVSVALGRLIEREVAAHHRRTSMDGAAVRDAVEDARRVAGELQALIGRLEEASSHGIGSSLTVPPTTTMADGSSPGSIAAA